MAQIDPRIAMGFAPTVQVESPMNNLARLLQVQGAQQSNQLNQLKMDEYQSGVQRKNKLASLLGGQYDTDEAREDALLRGGFMDEAQTLSKNRQERMKGTVELDEKRFKLANDRYNTFRSTLGALSQRPDLTKDTVIAVGQELVNAGIIPAEMYQRSIANMPDDPTQLRIRLQEGVKAQMTPEQMFTVFAPKAEKIDSGQQIMFRDTNPNSPTFGQNVGGAPVQKMQTPDSIASNETTRRGQNMVDARARDRLDFDKSTPKGVLDPERGLLVDPRTGEARPVTMGGKPVGMKQSSEVKKELLSINQQRSAIDGAIDAVRKTPSAFSLGRGLAGGTQIGESLAGRTETKDETVARGYVFNNVSRIINERAGAAQSAQELARLNSFLPAPTDNAEQIVNKLDGFKQYLADMERGTLGSGSSASPAPAKGGFKILSVE